MHKEAAEKVIERAGNTGKTIAVFIAKSGAVKATSTTTDLYREAIERSQDRLVGIYDAEARPEWIVEDVAYCKNLMAHSS